MKVCGAIAFLEHWHQDSNLQGVWILDVAQLEVELEAPPAFVPTQLDPELIARNVSIMPCEVTFHSGQQWVKLSFVYMYCVF